MKTLKNNLYIFKTIVRKLITILIFLFCINSLHSFYEAGTSIGFLQYTEKADDDPGKTSGIVLGFYSLYNFDFKVISLGVGLFLDLSSIWPTDPDPEVTLAKGKLYQIGGDLKISITAPIIEPYILVGIGARRSSYELEGNINNSLIRFELSDTGTIYHIFVGIKYKIVPLVGIFVQGGLYNGSLSGKINKMFVNGIESTGQTFPDNEITFTGYQVGGGVAFKL